MPISAQVITDLDEFRMLKGKWNELVARLSDDVPRFFSSWEWNFLWWECRSAGLANSRLQIFAFFDREQLVGIIPAYLCCRHGGICSLNLLGDTVETTLYADFIVAEPWREAILAEFGRIVAEKKIWYLNVVNALPDSSCRVFAERYPFRIHPAGECPFVNLPDSFPEFLGQRRRNMQRDRKRLKEDLGAQTVDLLPRGRAAIELLFDLHEQGFRQMGKMTRFRQEQRLEFHWKLIQSLESSQQVYLQGIELHGRVIGASYGFCSGRSSVGYQMGYDPAFRKYGIGFQLVLNETEWAIGRGLRQHDLSLGGGAHKEAFSGDSRQICRITAALNYPARALMWCGDGLGAGKRLAKRLLRPRRNPVVPDSRAKS